MTYDFSSWIFFTLDSTFTEKPAETTATSKPRAMSDILELYTTPRKPKGKVFWSRRKWSISVIWSIINPKWRGFRVRKETAFRQEPNGNHSQEGLQPNAYCMAAAISVDCSGYSVHSWQIPDEIADKLWIPRLKGADRPGRSIS
jgi:hypothetical protein